jgi:hypothetical protein
MLASTLAACGLSVTGATGEAGDDASSPPQPAPPPDDGAAPDVADDVSVGVPEAGDPCEPCGFIAPSGWSLVAYGAQTLTCPAGTPSDVVVNPNAANACTCSAASCTMTTKPGCNTGNIPTKYDDTGATKCDQTGSSLDANNGACKALGATFGAHAEIDAPTPTGTGTCTSKANANKAAATSTTSRVCSGGTCSEVCAPALAAGFAVCAAADGDVPCPGGLPTKHLVGADFDVACGNCTSCTVTATGCSGTMTFYSDGACNNNAKAFTSGACLSAGGSAGSYKWAGTPTGLACNVSGAPAGTVTLTTPRTVCCK